MRTGSNPSVLQQKRVDRGSPVPLYYQIRTHIHQQIASGQLSHGDQLPPFHRLAQHYSVSLAVIRQTVRTLEQEDVVETHQGRGVFIRKQGRRFRLDLLAGQFYGDATEMGLRLSLAVPVRELVPADEDMAKQLGIPPGLQLSHLLKIRLADGVPVLSADAYFPYSVCPDLVLPGLDPEQVNGLLEEMIYPLIYRSEAFASASVATESEARLLQIEAGAPIQVFEGLSRDVDDNALQYYVARAPSQRIRFGVQFEKLDITL